MKTCRPVTFLTGGTGFLGSHIGAELLKRGETVFFFTRASRKMPAAQRLKIILDWHGIDSSLRINARMVEGIPDKPIQGIGRVIHCASDTSFAERSRERVWASNVDFCQDLMDFALSSRIPSFVHISSAYAAGRRSGPCPEEAVSSTRFYNVYEESKAAAESLLLQRCAGKNISLTIIRPSIVYGDSRTGRTFRFNALYYPVKTALFLRRIFMEDIVERGGERAADAGVSLEPDGTTVLPIRIEVQEKGGLNLIPVDFFAYALFTLIQDSPGGGIYHIVSHSLTRVQDIIDYAKELFKIEGIRSCGHDDFLSKPRSSLELLFARYIEAYTPYIKDTRMFLTDKIDGILQHHGVVCPPFDKKMFRRCMSYAATNGWTGLPL